MPPRANTITLEEIADAFGVTTETIRLWRKDGLPSRTEAGRPRFVLRECIEWRREHDRLDDQDRTKPSERDERALKVRAERMLKELEYAEKRRELVPVSDSNDFIDQFVATFAATAAGRLQRFERDIVRAKTPADARQVTTAIHVSLMEGGQQFADMLEGDGAIAAVPPAATKPAAAKPKKKKPKKQKAA